MKNVYVYFPQEQFYKSVLVFMLRAFKVTLNGILHVDFIPFSTMGAIHSMWREKKSSIFFFWNQFFFLSLFITYSMANVCIRTKKRLVFYYFAVKIDVQLTANSYLYFDTQVEKRCAHASIDCNNEI